MLVYIIDVSDTARDPREALAVVEDELRAFNPELLERPRVIVGNKIDLPRDQHLSALHTLCAERGLPFFPLSAVTGEGVEPLVRCLADQLQTSATRQVLGAGGFGPKCEVR